MRDANEESEVKMIRLKEEWMGKEKKALDMLKKVEKER